jgi:hypothetical protein
MRLYGTELDVFGPVYGGVVGAGEWTRTTDLLITNQLLYQLSYTGLPDESIA